ncbi:ATP-binding cassette subfamily B protein [Silvibacterium bohemicum]|uniref:ATP-binding cassette subfamily B protein n=1 Tax=Silvibacterium bohemicum TaxID=1577686 RepID=A0A841JUX9_9BACT|nr:ABC transporter ATP-binding protein [Silvibacterium bohemicum]MBB6144277.1 ATP-binding cassette subfamily B protein [Silvibacterium bohemicum]
MFQRLKPLLPYMRRYSRSYVRGGVVTVLSNAVWIFFPKAIGSAIDDLNHGVTQRKIMLYAGLLLAIALAKGVFLFFTRWILIGISREIEFDLRNDLFLQLEKQPAVYYQHRRTGDIMARMTNDLNAVRMLLGPAIMYSANTLLFSMGALYFLLRISPMLTLIALVPLPLASVLVQTMGRKIHERFERIQAMYSDISAQAQENFSAARLVRAFAQEEAQKEAFEQSNQEYIRRGLRLVQLMGMLWPTLEFMLGLAMVIVLLVGGHEVLSHRISVGNFAAFATYTLMLTWPIIALGWVVNLFERGTASVTRIHELLAEEPTIDDRDANIELAGDHVIRGEIEFRHLTFTYGEASSQSVLRDISLTIPAGSSLALVGPTGAGKSTLVNLIPRIYDAPPGSVFIDGRPVREYPLDVLRESIGFVPQETFLFSETIRENILLGAPDASPEQMLSAAEAAHIRKEFEEFPHGFETTVGERGLTLSGGQKQRSALARALVRDPKILILDDALASVDTYTEERILEELRQRMQGRTTILISHRVSTVRNADRIAVLAGGRVAELGTHEELLLRGGYYAGLYEKQQLEEELAGAR